MSTRGYYVFVWNGWYFVFYNHFDSYPGYLGSILVDVIRSTNEEDWNNLKSTLESIKNTPDPLGPPSPKRRKYEKEGCDFSNKLALKGLLMDAESCIVTQKKPELDVYIEWIYFINLDENEFEINGTYYDEIIHLKYNLDNVPRRWYAMPI